MPSNTIILATILLAVISGCALSDRSDPRLGILFNLQSLRYTLPSELEERWRQAHIESTRPEINRSGGPATDCDRFAADPFDPDRVSRGVGLANIRPRLAVRVCNAAYRRDPNEPRIQYQLARGYLAAGNHTTALPMLQRAAEGGHLRAQIALADVYLRQGQRLGLNTGPAVRWLEKAAENGSIDSMARLGLIYFQGTSVDRNVETGVAWLERAASARQPLAMRALGKVRLRQVPTSENPKGTLREAFELFDGAAALGDGEAQHMLAMLYGAGQGTERNRHEYVRWIEEAAKSGHPAAQAKLGVEHLGFGDLVQDYPKSYFWISIAVRNGILEASSVLDFLAERMTPNDLRELDRVAAAWGPETELPRGWADQELAFAAIPAYETDDYANGSGEPEVEDKSPSARSAVLTTTETDSRGTAAGAQTSAPSNNNLSDSVAGPRPSAASVGRSTNLPQDPVLFSDLDFPEAMPSQ